MKHFALKAGMVALLWSGSGVEAAPAATKTKPLSLEMAEPGAWLWYAELEEAKAVAARNGKLVMMYFTRSDWSPECARMNAEVLDTAHFRGLATEHLVLMKVDFPKRTPMSARELKIKQELVAKYRVTVFPTLVFVNAQGQEIHRRGLRGGDVGEYMNSLVKDLGLVGKPSRGVAQTREPKPAEKPSPPPPLFGGAPVVPSPRYTNLLLKNISGTAARRFALVNNQTFTAGETALVQLEDSHVRVTCREIGQRSVTLQVEGEVAVRVVSLPEPP
jgi:disulfide reductase